MTDVKIHKRNGVLFIIYNNKKKEILISRIVSIDISYGAHIQDGPFLWVYITYHSNHQNKEFKYKTTNINHYDELKSLLNWIPSNKLTKLKPKSLTIN